MAKIFPRFDEDSFEDRADHHSRRFKSRMRTQSHCGKNFTVIESSHTAKEAHLKAAIHLEETVWAHCQSHGCRYE